MDDAHDAHDVGPGGPAPGFAHLADEVLHEGHVISLVIGRYRAPDGSTFTREIVRHPGAVSVVALHDDGTVSLVRQYRAALDRELLEIPAGKRDVADEPPEVTARRELVEEVGLVADRLEPLAEFVNSAGFSDEYSYVFLATGLRGVDDDRQGLEEQHMTVERVALADVPRLIAERRLIDAKTVIGLTLAREWVAGRPS
ncbi:NUDIX domain-containing protein [Rhabdothermincola salaria]|uniref:NUDIX domain-containing protein n=1 Tax=Rhabdothermincola salaria TaxID=2903142 RepID=UPI001E3D7EFD|nr:NUDIX hydrolase [Rhabdothermincola salaria]